MAVVAACIAAIVLGAFMAIRWGHLAIVPPWAPSPGATADAEYEPPELLLRVVWWAALMEWTGLIAGVCAAGAGGRLVMRLLAVTAGDPAQGRLTEAHQIVGRITAGGTIQFVIFSGALAGLLTSLAFFVVRRWLPSGRRGAVVFGVLTLVVLATRIDPLRSHNTDFRLVGPPWLALGAFSALAIGHSVLLVAVAGRLSRWLPMVSRRKSTVLAYLPLFLLALAGPIFVALALASGVIAVLGQRPAVLRLWGTRGVLRAGRVVLLLGALVSLPGFIGAVVDILGYY